MIQKWTVGTRRSTWPVVLDVLWVTTVAGQSSAALTLHHGEDCWISCGGLPGYCDWCGHGNACCREAWESDPEECRRAMGFSTHIHECVALKVDHEGEDCWGRCSEGHSGYCDWCGRGNACCKAGHEQDPPECKRAFGFSQPFHQCVKLSSEDGEQVESGGTGGAVGNSEAVSPAQQMKPLVIHPPQIIRLNPTSAAIDPLSLVMGGLKQIADRDLGHSQGGPHIVPMSGMPGPRIQFQGMKNGPPPQLVNQLQLMFKAMGDVSGQLGESSHFTVEDTEAGIRLTADLPGHKLGADGPHPLQVRVVGSSVVVKGAHVNPPIVSEFQRTFKMPQRVALSRIRVDYSTTTGKLVITVPSRLITEEEEDSEEEKARSSVENPTSGVFAEIEGKLPQFFKDRERVLKPELGFMPAKRDKEKEMADLLSSFEKQFTQHEVKEDNTTYLGCFSDDDLPADKVKMPEIGAYAEMKARAEGGPPLAEEVQLLLFNLAAEPMELWLQLAGGARKLLAELPAYPGLRVEGIPVFAKPTRVDIPGGHNALWVRPRSKEVLQTSYIFKGRHLLVYNGTAEAESRFYDKPLAEKREAFFAIARTMGAHLVNRAEWTLSGHGEGYVFSGIPRMPPSFGGDECGMRCIDGQHWCGCDPAADKEIFNCPGSARRFAVYALPLPNGTRAVPPRSRAVWHLHEDSDGAPILEVHAPPGRTLKNEDGRLLVVGQTSEEEPPVAG